MKLKVITILVFFSVIISILILLSPKLYLIHPKVKINPVFRKELSVLGAESIATLDVPVGAILVYKDSIIIGRGYNTVRKDHLAGGHAEINAISDAIRVLGWDGLRLLNHSELTIYSTYEPCPMCIGAMEEYHIKRCIFIKPKPLNEWVRADLRHLRYEWFKQKSVQDNLQDSLFMLYPGFQK